MKRIAVIGDVHDHRTRLEQVLADLPRGVVDLALLVGDVGCDPPWNEPRRHRERRVHDDSTRHVLDRVRGTLACPVAFVPGNHDLPDPPEGLPATNCDGRRVRIAGLRIAGLGGAGPRHYGFPYEWDEPEARRRLRALGRRPGRIDVLLCHAPPVDTPLDVTTGGEHAGSVAVAEAIRRLRPRMFVCGHIHEAWGPVSLGEVPCLNAGALGEPFGRALGWLIEWRNGPERIETIGG